MRIGRWKSLIHYPYEHLAYIRETKAEKVLIIINFSYEKELEVDEYIPKDNWQVLVSNVLEAGKQYGAEVQKQNSVNGYYLLYPHKILIPSA